MCWKLHSSYGDSGPGLGTQAEKVLFFEDQDSNLGMQPGTQGLGLKIRFFLLQKGPGLAKFWLSPLTATLVGIDNILV